MTIAVRQSVQNNLLATGTVIAAPAFTGGTAVQAGSYLYAAVMQNANATNGINLPTDTQSLTWTQFGSTLANGAFGQIAQFWALFAAGGNITVTGNFGATSTGRGILLSEITGSSGPDTVAGANGFKSNYQSTNPPITAGAVTSTNLTPSTQPGLIISASIDASFDSTITANTGAGFTNIAALLPSGAFWQFTDGVNHGGCEYLRYTSTSAFAATFTAGATNTNPGTVAALFVESGGGAPPALLGQICL